MEGILTTIKRFPFEVLFALCAAIAGTAWTRNHDYGSIYKDNCIRLLMMANLGLLLCLAASLFSESRGITGLRKYLLKSLAVLISVPFFWLLNPFDREYDILRFFLLSFSFHLLVAFAAFTSKGGLHGFWQFNKTLFLRFLAGMLYSGVLYLGLVAAILSTKYLFNIHWSDDIYLILWVWISCIFNTIFFLAGVPSDFNGLDADTSYPKALKIFTQYVLIPLATVYVIILLAYEVKILIEWRLPKGYVSSLILGYAVFGILSILLVHPIREQAENKWLKIYARSFYFLLIPLIVLLFLAMFARVLPYGITPQRYLLLVLAAWLFFITLYFLLSKKQNIKIIPISLCLLTLLSVYGPQGAFSVSTYSQRRILINIFKKYDAFKDGKLHSLKGKKVSRKDGSNAVNKLDFLVDNDDLDALQPYIDKDLKPIKDSLLKNEKGNDIKIRYSRYRLARDKVEWAKNYLGLSGFYENEDDYRYENKQGLVNYQLSTNADGMLAVKAYDYVITVGNDYNRSDSTTFHADNIRFVSMANINIRSLLINGELVKFDMKKMAEKIIRPESKLKNYKETDGNYASPEYKAYTVNDSLMTTVGQTLHYSVTFKISNLSFDYTTGDGATINSVLGHYLIKVK